MKDYCENCPYWGRALTVRDMTPAFTLGVMLGRGLSVGAWWA